MYFNLYKSMYISVNFVKCRTYVQVLEIGSDRNVMLLEGKAGVLSSD